MKITVLGASAIVAAILITVLLICYLGRKEPS
jgi:hypothetical protein